MIEQRAPRPWTGRRVLFSLMAFFGVVFGVNAIFVTLALSTFTGLETQQAYQKGLNFNRSLEQAEAQHALAWQLDLDLSRQASRTVVALSYRDAQDRPIAGLRIEMALLHPTQAAFDQTLVVSEISSGRYQVELPNRIQGRWRMVLQAEAAGGEIHRREDDLWLK